MFKITEQIPALRRNIRQNDMAVDQLTNMADDKHRIRTVGNV